MVRAPCCEKMGLKKGPWTRDEDQILINYINLYGHDNWRALPKLAGLLRCGKSCRLRWTNYLRPDIKRGNFSKEEEETILELHAALGNRWSAIAARLPGRTDNEIKNVWHTHLKKRANKPGSEANNKNPNSKLQKKVKEFKEEEESSPSSSSSKPLEMKSNSQTCYSQLNSPQHSSSEISSITNGTNTSSDNDNVRADAGEMGLENFPEMDEEFWSEVFSGENSGDVPVVNGGNSQLQISCGYESKMHDDMEFWFNVFTYTEELVPHLPQI